MEEDLRAAPASTSTSLRPGPDFHFAYDWQQHNQLRQKEEAMEKRREEILEQIEEGDSAHVSKQVQEEWLCLLAERNKLLHQLMEEEQALVKDEYIRDLQKLLQDLGTLPFNPEEQRLKQTLASLYHEVSTYCNTHKPEDRMRSLSAAIPPPPPPPPIIPPPTIQMTFGESSPATNELSEIGLMTNNKKVDGRVTSLQTPFRSHSPVRSHDDMIKIISSRDCRQSLRKTKHSPGGTPAPKKRHCPADDKGGLLQQALQKKFQHVYGSPTITEEDEISHDSPRVPLGASNKSVQLTVTSTPCGQHPDDLLSPSSLKQGETNDKENMEKNEVLSLLVETM